MNTLEHLKAARELIADPEKWTKCSYAKTKQRGGASVPPDSPRAKCWCAVGAIRKVGPYAPSASIALMHALPVKWQWTGVPSFNDDPGTSHADVLALFDRAIAAEEART